LLEMSRQRIRTSVLESSTEKCPVCGGSGHVRSVSSVALQLLRAIEEMLNKGATHNLIVRTRSEVALYVLNHKRGHLRALEERFRITITISADATVNAQVSYIVDRGEQVHTPEAAKALAAAQPQITSPLEADEDAVDALAEEEAEDDELEAEAGSETDHGPFEGDAGDIEQVDSGGTEADGERPERSAGERGQERGNERGEREGGRRRRRRGRGRGRGGEPREGGPREGNREGFAPREGATQFTGDNGGEHAVAHEDHNDGAPEAEGAEQAPHNSGAPGEGAEGDVRRRRRRGRRGGRRNKPRNGDGPHENGQPQEGFAQERPQGAADFPPVSDEDASGIAPPFERSVTVEPPPHTYAAAPEPKPAPALASSEPPPQEAPRRRSTIREPAPIGASAQAAAAPVTPPPEPVVSSTAPETAAPKRGWWGKRLLGD
jgi:ribonuclease E